jgi:DNA-binding NtrC family response regulator
MRPTVLVVDYVSVVRRLLTDFLYGSSFEVLEASDGEQAIRVIERVSIQVVLTDVRTSRVSTDGLVLGRWIHEHRPDLKVILTSGILRTLDPADASLHEGQLLQKLSSRRSWNDGCTWRSALKQQASDEIARRERSACAHG